LIRSYQKEIAYFIAVAGLVFAVVYMCPYFAKSSGNRQFDAHSWLHRQTSITAEQDRALAEIEKKFSERQHALQADIHAGNLELAKAMTEDRKFSERVSAAVEHIHHAQGELQKAAVEHIFEMQAVLTPEQAERLNKLAADALIQNP